MEEVNPRQIRTPQVRKYATVITKSYEIRRIFLLLSLYLKKKKRLNRNIRIIKRQIQNYFKYF